ncbi:MAG: GSCFA domain-containing protein [Tannerella sp.]|nr:GSCFA domain-containing protein [Tannerella sp.]
MNLYSKIDIPPSPVHVSYGDAMMSIGSCFAENIGNMLFEHKFTIDLNPFGVLYNPKSIACAIRRLLQPAEQTSGLFFHEGLFHSFAHHGSFSGVSEADCLRKINERLFTSASNLLNIKQLFITFGTSWFFRLREDGRVVANCHKLPDKMFERERLTVKSIIDEWEELLSALWTSNSGVKVVFSVSPVRHWKDGAHGNTLSKSILLLAVDALQAHYPGQVFYFPAYELVMDELRDYRFYAEDLFHPSPTAVRYLFERFVDTFMDATTRTLLAEVYEIKRALAHRPFHSESDSYTHFMAQTLLKIEQLHAKMPYICFGNETEEIKFSLQRKADEDKLL